MKFKNPSFKKKFRTQPNLSTHEKVFIGVELNAHAILNGILLYIYIYKFRKLKPIIIYILLQFH